MRMLEKYEIDALTANGCTADDWGKILVHEQFDPQYVRNTSFSGSVSIGSFDRTFELEGGLQRHSGIFNAVLHNVEVGDDCFICNVNGYISNYRIGKGCFIFNVGKIVVDGRSSFGNGIDVRVLNETGGHEVMIYDNLTAQQAYMMAMCRHRPQMLENLRSMISTYSRAISSETGEIGDNVVITDTMSVRDVKIGPCARIEGASKLRNGSVNSTAEAPVYIGSGVVAMDFIICSGSCLDISAAVNRCFVGQACELSETYYASDSLFFANCFGGNGEACAVFAGPFTVTHHKSTLLIAGMFSFMNAGSGSNQSNHLYKLGPVHSGVLERGSKTTSDSYVLWPARTGAFTLIMGRHVQHLNTDIFPFSYLIERNGNSFIFPGANLRSVGTIRDVKKWPKRDRRCGNKLDCINFNLLSPYTMSRALRGLDVLKHLLAENPESEVYQYEGASIKSSSLKKGISFYELMADKFLGNSLVSRIQKAGASSLEDLHKSLLPDGPVGEGAWEDLSGMITPSSETERLISDIEEGRVSDIRTVNERILDIHGNYYSYEWTWAYYAINKYYGIDLSCAGVDQIKSIIEKWKRSVLTLDEMLCEDAAKEFRLSSVVYSHAGDEKSRMENDPFVQSIREHMSNKTALFAEVIDSLSFKQ